jgi:putative endonuclease
MTLKTKALGGRGEAAAAEYLRKRGYRLLAQNFRVKLGEIDLVALDRGCVCFVEVKTRRTYDAPQEAVSRIKQRKLTRLAQAYLQKHYGHCDVRCRFDVLAIEETEDGAVRIELFENAFDAVG